MCWEKEFKYRKGDTWTDLLGPYGMNGGMKGVVLNILNVVSVFRPVIDNNWLAILNQPFSAVIPIG
jgi:hypothetical protein